MGHFASCAPDGLLWLLDARVCFGEGRFGWPLPLSLGWVQKLASMLCWAHSSRALNVVRNGSSLSFTSTEAPRDSFTMAGEAPGIRASFGILKRSPLPLSTYAPGSLIDSHVTSVSASLRTACADWVMVSSFGLGIGFLLCEVPP